MVKDNEIVDVEPANGPSNKGLLCVKGRFGSFHFVHSPERLKYPLIKNHETGEFERATWDEALDLIAAKFTEIKKSMVPMHWQASPAPVLRTRTAICCRRWSAVRLVPIM